MNKIHIIVPHELGKEKALDRVQAFIATAKNQIGNVPNAPKGGEFKEEWKENVGSFDFSAQGMSVSGTAVVNDANVDATVKLPLAAMFFKGKLETALTDVLKAMLA